MVSSSVPRLETPEEIFLRGIRKKTPLTERPRVEIQYCQFANANRFIRWDAARLSVRISDVLEGAPAQILHFDLDELFEELKFWVRSRADGEALARLEPPIMRVQ